MAYRVLDRAQMSVSGTPGTGAVTLASATTGYQDFATAGVDDQDTFRYLIVDGSNWEIGIGTYTASGTSLARTTITASSNSNAAISATSAAVVSIVWAAEDIAPNRGNWTSLTFTNTTTIFGSSGIYVSDQTFVLAAGEMLEVDGYCQKSSSGNALLGVSEDGSNGYVFFNGNDGNCAINYYNGSYNNIINTGAVSGQNWTGLHKLSATLVCVGSDSNNMYATIDGQNLTAHADTNIQLVGTNTIYLQTSDITKCTYRARVVQAHMFLP